MTKNYKIFLKKDEKDTIKDLILVKEGFIFSALLFGFFWLFYCKVWREGLLTLLAFILSHFLAMFGMVGIALAFVVQIGITLGIAFFGSDFYANSLIRKKYEFLGYSTGKDESEAKLRFLDKINEKNKNIVKYNE